MSYKRDKPCEIRVYKITWRFDTITVRNKKLNILLAKPVYT